MQQDKTVFDNVLNPYLQAGICLALALLFMLISAIIKIEETFPWVIAGSFALLFSLFNSIIMLRIKDMKQYWQRSIFSFIGMLVIGGLLAYLFSGIGINDAGSFRWIFIILTFGYLSFLSIVAFIKRMFFIIAREEERMHGNKID